MSWLAKLFDGRSTESTVRASAFQKLHSLAAAPLRGISRDYGKPEAQNSHTSVRPSPGSGHGTALRSKPECTHRTRNVCLPSTRVHTHLLVRQRLHSDRYALQPE